MDIVTIDTVYEKYLGKCGLNVIRYPPVAPPASIYNFHLDHTKMKYVCFIHSDVTTDGFLEAVARTILKYPDFGAIGAVGTKDGCKWGQLGNIQEVITVDSCCIVINTDHGLRFDNKTFNEFHLYVEDYCMQVGALGKKVYTLDIDGYEYKAGLILDSDYFVHHSHTLNREGCSWGSYPKFRKLLSKKWPGVQTT